MYLPVLSAVSTSEIYISGDVTIDDSAVIAPGVILQAAEGSRIVIGAGACIGMGSILKAYGGAIELQDNAILGAGVLIIGNSKINSQVCVGTSTTIYNTSLDSGTIIPAGSIIGDPTRSLATSSPKNYSSSSVADVAEQKENISYQPNKQDFSLKPKKEFPSPQEVKLTSEVKEEKEKVKQETLVTEAMETDAQPEQDWDVTDSNNNKVTEDPWQTSSQNINLNQNPVIGQVYINKLLCTLFPEKQPKEK
jgi:carbon dioxide concentrating mechanism protein CcmN